MAKRSMWQHWIAIFMAGIVVAIFLTTLTVFQVNETEMAMVMRLGKPLTTTGPDGAPTVRIYEAGAHLKWPLIDEVWRHDNRRQCYELKIGQTEQVQTADQFPVIVTTFSLWRVGDPAVFQRRVNTSAAAESILDNKIRDARNNVIGRHNLSELINTDPKKVRISEVEDEIRQLLRASCEDDFGIVVDMIGFKHIGFPEEVTNKVFDRMRSERESKSVTFRAQGQSEATTIRAEADRVVSNMLNKAEAEATRIRGEGDSVAAQSYEVFARNPALAVFLRKLEALRQGINEKTTLILDTNTPPYDLLRQGAGSALPPAPVVPPVAPVPTEAPQ